MHDPVAQYIAINALVLRNPTASVFLPSENEWYKAAYYGRAFRGLLRLPDGDKQRDGLLRAGLGHRQLGELHIIIRRAWNEQIPLESSRNIRGRAWSYYASYLAASEPGLASRGDGVETVESVRFDAIPQVEKMEPTAGIEPASC